MMDLDRALPLEWLETNGMGGFASSTVAGINTRRYHGLLTAATKPPVGRYLLLSKLEETLVLGDRRCDFSSNLYPGVIHPRGFEHLESFDTDWCPRFVYRVGTIIIEKRVYMLHDRNATVIEYAMSGDVPEGAHLELRPLIAFRDYHATTHANPSINPGFESSSGLVMMEPYPGLPRLYLTHNASSIEPAGNWYFNFEYPIELERGLDDREDLFCPLVATFSGRSAVIVAATEPIDLRDLAGLRAREVSRRQAISTTAPVEEPLVTALVRAADHYIVRRGDLYSIIAGYHWFSDWGRDTMIALPGLTLVTGRYEIAKSILLAYAAHLDHGMLPNRFPDAGDAPEYNTIDATLWFVEAVRSYLDYTGDIELVRHLYDRLVGIIDWHLNGTRYGIHVDYDGLLIAGGPGSQLTWMDAKIGDFVPTPRHGKPVEIQALWYNAIRFIHALADRFSDNSSSTLLRELAPRTRAAFERQFWNESTGCLYDVIDGDRKDASIRPNQVIALSLPHCVLSNEQACSALAVVERELLTPYGLRTLARSDPHFRGHYLGGPAERDGMYHQGTVWPWLMGPFIRAYIRAHKGSTEARTRAVGWLAQFQTHVHHTGIVGHVSEILDGEAPHTPRGCAAQAWSVGELLRAAVEDVYQVKPASGRTQQFPGGMYEAHSTVSGGTRRGSGLGR